jgi:hypothetical protein
MAKKIRVWDGSAWQDVSVALPYNAVHSAQASMPSTAVDGQIWLDTDGTLAGQDFVPLTGGTMTGNLNTPSINSGGITGQNYIINGGMDVWQRGTSFTGGQFTADRWTLAANSGTLTASRSTDVPSNLGFSYSYSMGGTGLNTQIYTRLESLQSARFAGQTVTYSVYAKSTAGSSPLSYVGIYPTATDDWSGSNVTDIQGNFIATPAGAWTRYSATFTVNALATRGYDLRIYRNGTETSTTLLTGIKLEIGNQATPFSRAQGTIAGELAACQRYYQRFSFDTINVWMGIGHAGSGSTTQFYPMIKLNNTMRVKPFSVDYSSLAWWNGGNPVAVSSVSINNASPDFVMLTANTTGLTQNNVYILGQASAPAYLGFSAEL